MVQLAFRRKNWMIMWIGGDTSGGHSLIGRFVEGQLQKHE